MVGGLQQSQSQHPSWQQQSTSEGGRKESQQKLGFFLSSIIISLSLSRGSAHAVDARTLARHVFAGDSRRSIFTLFLFLGVTGSSVVVASCRSL